MSDDENWDESQDDLNERNPQSVESHATTIETPVAIPAILLLRTIGSVFELFSPAVLEGEQFFEGGLRDYGS
jgi:hypothetical protein